ncbi:urease accessory protein UreD [Bradyrhizobium sp. 186]|uniref:urease accessory protein UreD n=1 Tax=Bradyrhizobium sp. 186 TaxID=2782654 RepID=UPI002000FDFD|nr:urease accessory protein UreD [Bradyrhizobium sp. 186]UPK32605.1 urease accessory protein UreD [Bradyrhizobium sp. 186]
MFDLSFVRRANRTVIDRRLFAWPFVLTRSFYLDPDRPNCLSVIVQTGSGAVHGEDRLVQRLVLNPGTAVCLTNQGATSVHRADPAARAVETINLCVAGGASLEYLLEPRILFPDAALSQSVELDCANDGSALIVDAFTMHDPRGEARGFRELESTFCLRRSGSEPLVIERTRLHRPDPGIFRGYLAFGSAFLVLTPSHDHADIQASLITALSGISGLYAAASVLPGAAGLGVRLAASDLTGIRAAFASISAIYRQALLSVTEQQAAPLFVSR